MENTLYDTEYTKHLDRRNWFYKLRTMLTWHSLKHAIDPKKDDAILEIGCNKGYILDELSKYSDYVCGVDVNMDALKNSRHDVKVMSATDLKFRDETFDKLVAIEVVEHIPQIRKVFKEACRVLKRGGFFVVTFPFELIRGQSVLHHSLIIYKNLSSARKLHVHRLFPGNIKEIISGLPLKVKDQSLKFMIYPSFVMVLEKT